MTKEDFLKILRKKRYILILLSIFILIGIINLFVNEIQTGVIILVINVFAVFMTLYKEDPE